MNSYPSKQNRGFTLLFASLVVSLILSVSLAIANLTLSQLTLSSAGRESQFAFYNADSGIECALYYENKVSNSNGGAYFPRNGTDPLDTNMTCNGLVSAAPTRVTGTNSATSTYKFNLPATGCDTTKPGYSISVGKSQVGTSTLYNVYVESRGYNTCDSTNPRRVERGLYAKLLD